MVKKRDNRDKVAISEPGLEAQAFCDAIGPEFPCGLSRNEVSEIVDHYVWWAYWEGVHEHHEMMEEYWRRRSAEGCTTDSTDDSTPA